MDAQKSSKLKKNDFLTYNHPWRSQPHRDRDLGHESSLMFLRHWQDNSKFDLMDEQEPTIGLYRSDVRSYIFYRSDSINQVFLLFLNQA